MTPTISIVVGLVAFVAGLYLSRWQKQIDRHTELLRERRAAYLSYLIELDSYILENLGEDTDKKTAKFLELRKKEYGIRLIGSDLVLDNIRKLQNLVESSDIPKDNIREIGAAQERVILAMRADTFAFNVVPLPIDRSFRVFLRRGP